MTWKKGVYYIQCRKKEKADKIIIVMDPVQGYICELADDLQIGITNKIGKKPAGMWIMSVLPEGLMFKTFKRKMDAYEFISGPDGGEKFIDYIREIRRRNQ